MGFRVDGYLPVGNALAWSAFDTVEASSGPVGIFFESGVPGTYDVRQYLSGDNSDTATIVVYEPQIDLDPYRRLGPLGITFDGSYLHYNGLPLPPGGGGKPSPPYIATEEHFDAFALHEDSAYTVGYLIGVALQVGTNIEIFADPPDQHALSIIPGVPATVELIPSSTPLFWDPIPQTITFNVNGLQQTHNIRQYLNGSQAATAIITEQGGSLPPAITFDGDQLIYSGTGDAGTYGIYFRASAPGEVVDSNPLTVDVVSLVGLWPAQDPVSYLPIIRNGRGFGMDTVAGSGRGAGQGSTTIIKVTTLNPTGPGSLRAAVDSHNANGGPTTIIFEVSGVCNYTGGEYTPIPITAPYLTIAGESAPSPGYTFRGGRIGVGAGDVCIRHIKSRPGVNANNQPENIDAFEIGWDNSVSQFSKIVVDHCSFSWSHDEIATNFYKWDNCTYNACIMSEPLDNVGHPNGGAHGYAGVFDERGGNSFKLTMSRNLFATIRQRPLVICDGTGWFNNVWYNYIDTCCHFQNETGVPTNNSIYGNHWKAGPNGVFAKPLAFEDPTTTSQYGTRPILADSLFYIDNNVGFIRGSGAAVTTIDNQWDLVISQPNGTSDWEVRNGTPSAPGNSWPTGLVPLDNDDTDNVFDAVMSDVGAFPGNRDAVDARVVAYTQNGTGPTMIDSEAEVGGYDTTSASRALSVPANKDNVEGNGYTVLENWLREMEEQIL